MRSNPGPGKSYTALQSIRYRFNINHASSCVTLALWLGVEHRKLVTRLA